MVLIIPDNILDTLLCSFCHKYLSVKPVKIYPNRRIQCGRCVDVDKKEPALQKSQGVESLYGKIAEHVLFKCVNRFDGCRELLTYSQVRDHEKICLEKNHKCPICDDEMASFMMFQHFHFKHKNAVLDCPTLVFNLKDYLEMPSVYIYQQEDNLFFLYINYSKSENTLKLDLVYMGSFKLAKNIYHEFTVSSENKEFDIVLKPKPCTDEFVLDISYMSNFIQIKFKLIDRNLNILTAPEMYHQHLASAHLNEAQAMREPILKKAPQESQIEYTSKFNQKCKACQEYCMFSITRSQIDAYYIDEENNYVCYYCYEAFKSNLTATCYRKRKIPLHIFDAMKFFKWNCSKCCSEIEFSDIRSHEISCKLGRQFTCPIGDCCEKGTVNQMIKHLKDHNCLAFSSYFIKPRDIFSCYVFVREHIVYLEELTSAYRSNLYFPYEVRTKLVTKTDNKEKVTRIDNDLTRLYINNQESDRNTPYVLMFYSNNEMKDKSPEPINYPTFVKVIVI
ncbi:uncharacterized protein LOC114339586 isoform X1 [Diabrotica virgifera virgifera]|uniref:SIAH-type domain-containing protein n=1 Tax=Diabrotica virgifera virgifera TaxID=50390 RepID=A0ABM5L438_DIAVI|nr:uncharacterized protein LOC114339586 isoform X1 [Diabrotica virgifera virgifera]